MNSSKVSNWLQYTGTIASLYSIIVTIYLINLLRGQHLFFFLSILLLLLLTIISYLFLKRARFWRYFFIWVQAIGLLLLSYPTIFFIGILYLPGAILSLVCAFSSLNLRIRWIWLGLTTTMFSLFFISLRLLVLFANNPPKLNSEMFFYLSVIFAQVVAIFGYILFKYKLGQILEWIGAFALATLFIRDFLLFLEVPEKQGLLFPLFSFFLAISVITSHALSLNLRQK